MKAVTGEEMRSIDRHTIESIGIPGPVLMENAGLEVVRAIVDKYPPCTVSIFVGKGNNGGDGLVIARHLTYRGYKVKTYIMAEPEKFTGDALLNLKIAQNLCLPMEFILSSEQLDAYEMEIAASHLLVDAIFGTGLKGAVSGFAGDVISFINSTGLPVIAVDLPSGLEADTGKVQGPCIHAAITVTMALPKRGLLLYPGANFVGELKVVDIGIPEPAIDSFNIDVNVVTEHDAAKLVPDRPRNAHKGTFGKALIIAGAPGFTGAAAMTTEAALRIGAGLVTLGIPESLNQIMEIKLTEAMTKPLPETEQQTLSHQAKEEIKGFIESADVVALGPGLSRNPETVSLVQDLCKEIRIPKVIDADGLNALADNKAILEKLGQNTILTPHPGEMARLVGRSISDIQSDRIEISRNFAVENSVILVLKGAPTIIAAPDGTIYLNTTGNPGMASGGTGDVLTGAITGLIAQGLSLTDAAVLGVYIHGLAGDMAAAQKGEAGMLAGDVLENLPQAMKRLIGG